MASVGSITRLLEKVKAGDLPAWERLYERMQRRLLGLARKRLWGRTPALGGADDVVAVTLWNLFQGIRADQFPRLHNRDDLWQLLATIVTRKACDLIRRSAPWKSEPMPCGDAELQDADLPVDLAVLSGIEVERLLAKLADDQLQQVAVWSMEGYTNAEIAVMLGRTTRTVERKLELIRAIWSEERPT